MTISINPMTVSVASGFFGVSSDGYVQGVALDDPALRNELAGGILASTETIPMWGGVAIYETIPTDPTTLPMTTPWSNLGGIIQRATSATQISGFSVLNQSHAWIITPQSQVPSAQPNMSVNFYRLGCGMRVAVQCDPSLASLGGGPISGATLVSWDFASQMLVPYNAGYAANTISAATWASTSGGQITFTTGTAHGVGVGTAVDISGVVPAGYNGHYITLSGTTGSTIIVANPVNPGAYVSGGALAAGGGAISVKVLKLQIGNSKTVNWDGTNLTWNNAGSCAEILL